jgi:ligand-binding sensor domain-containing protein
MLLSVSVLSQMVERNRPVPLMSVKMTNLSIDDGLSQGYISAVLQDRSGYLWIATMGGLNRYDGYSFSVYQNDDDTNSIASNNIQGLFEDSEGQLWIGFQNGALDLFDPLNNKFRHILPSKHNNKEYEPASFSFIGTSGNSFIIAKNREILSITIHKKVSAAGSTKQPAEISIQELKPAAGSDIFLWGNLVKAALLPGRRIWIVDHSSALFEFKVDISHKQYRFIEFKLPLFLVPANTLKQCPTLNITDSRRNLIYFQQYGNLYRMEESTGKVELFMKNETVNSFALGAADEHGDLWSTNNGFLYKINVNERKGHFVNSDDPLLLKKMAGTCSRIYMGQSDNLWICTIGYGLVQLNLRNINFNHIKPTANSTFSTRRMYKSPAENLFLVPWMGDQCFFDSTSMKLIPCTWQLRNEGLINGVNKKMPVACDKGKPLLPEKILRQGKFFLAEWQHTSLVLIEPNAGVASLVFKEQRGELGPFLLSKENRIWYVAEKNILVYTDIATGNNGECRLPVVAGNAADAIATDSLGNIWLSTENGVCSYNPANQKWNTYLHDSEKTRGLAKGKILCFCFSETIKGKVWIGFEGKGLCSMDIASGNCRYFTERQGLPDKVVYGILPDHKGNFWISTNKGISCYTPSIDFFRNYTFKDGLQSNEFNRHCFIKLSSGHMVFGGVNGINFFHPDHIRATINSAFVKITDLFVNNQPVAPWVPQPELQFSLLTGDKPVFEYDHNLISFIFASSDLTAPDQNVFSYMLEGIDKQWSQPGSAHQATFTYLPPGEYTFRVKGANRDGVWSSNEISFPFSITPPWWQTWWFRLLLAALVFAIIYFVFSYRLRQLVKLQAIRNRISADMHDEIGSTLSSITFYSQALLMQNPEEKQKKVLEKIKDNAQNVQEGLSDIVWSVKASMDNIQNVFVRMFSFGTELLESKNIAFHFSADEKLRTEKMDMAQRKDFYLIFKEAINNAAKYSQCKNVWVTIRERESEISMEVKDDGKGFDMATAKSGNGLSNMKSRAAQIKGNLDVESYPGTGTVVRLSFHL